MQNTDTNGMMLCECGCGTPTKIAPKTDRAKGWVKGQAFRFAYGHRNRRTAEEAAPYFWSQVNREGPIHPVLQTRCWLWLGSLNAKGYGQVNFGGMMRSAQRMAWRLVYGEWPEGDTCHKCDNPPCVNIDHLWDGPRIENVHDAISKKRHAHGESNGQSKLTNENIIEMRKEYATGTVSYKDLGNKYGVDEHVIGYAVRGQTWKHIPILGEVNE